MRARLGKGMKVPLAHNDDNFQLRSVNGLKQMLVPQSLVPRVLHLSHQRQNGRTSGSMTPFPIFTQKLLLAKHVCGLLRARTKLHHLCQEQGGSTLKWQRHAAVPSNSAAEVCDDSNPRSVALHQWGELIPIRDHRSVLQAVQNRPSHE